MFLTFWLYLQKITTKETTASAVGPKVMMFLIRGERVGAIKVGHLQAQAHLAIWKGYLISIHQFFPLRNSIIFHFKIVPIFLHPPILFQRLFCRGSWVNRDIFYSSEICRGLNFRHASWRNNFILHAHSVSFPFTNTLSLLFPYISHFNVSDHILSLFFVK